MKGGAIKEPRLSGQAGGTHPTGMLSCFWCSLHLKINFTFRGAIA